MAYPSPEAWLTSEYGQSIPVEQTEMDPFAMESQSVPPAPPPVTASGASPSAEELEYNYEATPAGALRVGPLSEPGREPPRFAGGAGRPPQPSLPPELAPQFGGYYMPPEQERIAIQNKLIAEGKMDPGQLVQAAQQGMAYDRSLPGMRNDLARDQIQSERDQLAFGQQKAGSEINQLAAAAQLVAHERAVSLEFQKQAQINAAERQAAVSREIEKQRQMNDDLTKNARDPDRWWNSKSTGAQIMLSISSALGAFGSGLTGAPNMAADMISKAIDRDMAAQDADAAAKEKQIRGQGELADRISKLYDDRDMQRAAIEMFAQNHYASLTRQLALEGASDQARIDGEAAAKAMDAKAAMSEDVLKIGAATAWENEQRARAQQAMAGQQQAAQRQRQAELLDYSEWDDKARERAVPALGLMAPTAADATKIKDSAVLAQQITGTTDEMQRLIDSGASTYGSKASAEYDAKRGIIMAAVNVMLGQGAISKDDASRVEMSIPEAKTLGRNTNAKAALAQTGNYVNGMVRSNLIQRGAVPYERVQMLDAKGNPKNMYREGQPKPLETLDIAPVK